MKNVKYENGTVIHTESAQPELLAQLLKAPVDVVELSPAVAFEYINKTTTENVKVDYDELVKSLQNALMIDFNDWGTTADEYNDITRAMLIFAMSADQPVPSEIVSRELLTHTSKFSIQFLLSMIHTERVDAFIDIWFSSNLTSDRDQLDDDNTFKLIAQQSYNLWMKNFDPEVLQRKLEALITDLNAFRGQMLMTPSTNVASIVEYRDELDNYIKGEIHD